MLRKLRLMLLPVSWLYGFGVWFRNGLYTSGVLKRYRIPGKSIVVGNLSTGGTGKSPMVDLLIQQILELNQPVATLSRGYGRSTHGLLEVTQKSTAKQVGDEPLMYKQKHGDQITSVVAEKRAEGVKWIRKNTPENTVILLDDAFQHLAVKAGLNILVTPFDDLYSNDFILPAGNLREWRAGRKRADIVMVSKCPDNLDKATMESVRRKLRFPEDRIFFSSIQYGTPVSFTEKKVAPISDVLIVTGIGNPSPFIRFWSQQAKCTHLSFPDHHSFTAADITKIHEKFDTFASCERAIVTTEKDRMRLKEFKEVFDDKYPWYFQPIELNIIDRAAFNEFVNGYLNEV